MKQTINEIGNTPQGMYALGQVAGRAYDRMFNGTKNSVGDGIVALNPKYGKVAQDAAYAAAGGYMDWRKKFKEQNGREPSDDEYRAWMQNYKNGSYDYGKPESEKRGVAKISESQLRNMIAESVKRTLKEWRVTYEQLNAIERFESAFNDLSEVLANKTTQYLDTRDKAEEILNSIATDIVNLRVLFHMPEKETDGFGTDGMRAF